MSLIAAPCAFARRLSRPMPSGMTVASDGSMTFPLGQESDTDRTPHRRRASAGASRVSCRSDASVAVRVRQAGGLAGHLAQLPKPGRSKILAFPQHGGKVKRRKGIGGDVLGTAPMRGTGRFESD